MYANKMAKKVGFLGRISNIWDLETNIFGFLLKHIVFIE